MRERIPWFYSTESHSLWSRARCLACTVLTRRVSAARVRKRRPVVSAGHAGRRETDVHVLSSCRWVRPGAISVNLSRTDTDCRRKSSRNPSQLWFSIIVGRLLRVTRLSQRVTSLIYFSRFSLVWCFFLLLRRYFISEGDAHL